MLPKKLSLAFASQRRRTARCVNSSPTRLYPLPRPAQQQASGIIIAFCARVSMPMDVLTLDLAQMSYERRKPLITRGGKESGRRVKPEHISKAHKAIARQQEMAVDWHGDLACSHEVTGRWRDREHAVAIGFVHRCPAGLDRRPNARPGCVSF